MKKILNFIVLVIFLFSFKLADLYADLGNFKDDFKKEESEKKTGSQSSFSDSSADDGCFDEACGEICLTGIVLWGMHNWGARYDQYPYQFTDSNNYINNNANIMKSMGTGEINKDAETKSGGDNPEKNKESENASESSNKSAQYEGKSYYFTLESGGQYAFDNGNGYFAALRGKFFRVIGPELEAKRFIDGEDHLDYYALGLNIPILQFSGCMADFYFQKIFLKGIMERDGFGYGIIVNSYPIKPLSFMIRIGEQSYNNARGKEYGSIDFMDYEIRAGVIYNRFELFAGYRHMKAKYAEINGPVIGLKIFI